SSRHIFAQVIDDEAGATLVSASTMEADLRALDADKSEKARKVGEIIAQRADDAGVTQVVFDRAGHKYHGRIAAVADGEREGGLQLRRKQITNRTPRCRKQLNGLYRNPDQVPTASNLHVGAVRVVANAMYAVIAVSAVMVVKIIAISS